MKKIFNFLKNSGGIVRINLDIFNWNIIPRIKRVTYYKDNLTGKQFKGFKLSFLFIKCEMWFDSGTDTDNNTNIMLH